MLHLGQQADDFIWATGIENTFVPQTKGRYRALDEYELIGHYDHWREDLALARDLGLQAIRWGVPWYRVEPAQGVFDWSWTDQVIPYIVEDLGLTPILDLMHYGCPFWLKGEFINPEYPQAVAAYAAAFARRYGHLVRWYTPLNEPLINALLCGKRGHWPPYLRGDSGYVRVMVQLAKGIVKTVQALKALDPGFTMVHVEATGLSRALREDLQVLALEDQRRGFLCYDLITGRVTPTHPLFSWLVRNGASPDDLAQLLREQIELDLLGLNFYPQWSTQQMYVNGRGQLAYRLIEQDGAGFSSMVRDYYQQYQVPIIITETSAHGPHTTRSQWLDSSVAQIKHLREQGVPVLGYTWFPLFTMVDWRYRQSRGPVESYYLDLGLYTLGTSGPRWNPTPLIDQLRSYIDQPREAVGNLAPAPALWSDRAAA